MTISTVGGEFTKAKQTIAGLVGSSSAGAKVAIFDGGVKIGSAQVNAVGHWVANVNLTHQGVNVVTAVATDASRESVSEPVEYTLHSFAPKVTIAGMSQNVSKAKQTLSGAVDLADAGSDVSIFDGGLQIGSAKSDSAGLWSTSVTLVNEGANIIRAVSMNAAGTGSSGSLIYNLHTFAPSVSVTTSSQTVSKALQTISGVVDLADISSTVSVFDNGVKIGSAHADAAGRWSTMVTLARQGVNRLIAVAGNIVGAGHSTVVSLNLIPQSVRVSIVNAGSSGQTYVLENQSYDLALGGYANQVIAGDGDNFIAAGAGQERITLGDGRNYVTLAGYGNQVLSGSGANTVTGGLGNATLRLGNGANSVRLGGFQNTVTVGNGANDVATGSGSAIVSAGSGVNKIVLAGFNNVVRLNGGVDTVVGGQGGDRIALAGGSGNFVLSGTAEELNLGVGASANILDNGASLTVAIDSHVGHIVVAGFANDATGVIELFQGSGGYATTDALLGSLRSDGHGGSTLLLGSAGSIDITGVAPAQLSASRFAL